MGNKVRKWYGWAKVEPIEPVIAGSYGTWRLIYTAGRYGITNNGMLLVCWRFAWDWGIPQVTEPSKENYLTAHTDGNAKVRATYKFKGHIRPWYHVVQVEVFDGELYPGEHIELIFGDTSFGSPGQRAPTAVGICEWKVFVDCFQTRRFMPLDEYPILRIVSGKARRLVAVLPSDAVVGEKSWLLVRVEDAWGNPSANYEGTVHFLWEEGGEWKGLPSRYTFTKSDRGVKRFDNLVPKKPDVHRLLVIDEASGLKTISNPCQCHEKPIELRRFWGDLHGQSEEALGLGSAFDYFKFARDIAALDFASNQGNDLDITNGGWRQIQEATHSFNEPHRFVTFLGYEWSGNTSGGGDRNVIFLKDNEHIYRSSHGNLEDLSDISSDRYPITELFKIFEKRRDVILIPHVGGRYADLSFHEPSLEPLIEIYSGWGLFEWFINEALKRGMKVGFVAGSDDHKGRPGASFPGAHIFGVYGGLTCVLAKELTREEIFKALRSRRCYATSGQRILLDATCNGHLMGEEFNAHGKLEFQCHVIGTNGIEAVEIFKFESGYDRAKLIYSHPINAKAPLSDKVKIVWEGLRQKHRYFQTIWDGSISLSMGKILGAEGYAFDNPMEGIVKCTEREVFWKSQTVGDKDGIILTIKAPPDAQIIFKTKPCSFKVFWREVGREPLIFEAGGIDQRVSVKRLPEAEPPKEVRFSWIDEKPPRKGAYYIKVTQVDGAVAYSSPFYINNHNSPLYDS